MTDLIKLENVNRIFQRGPDTIRALNNITLQVRDGEYLAITGSSGSGKSTLLYLLGLLDTPSSGNYLLDNKFVSGLSDSELSRSRNALIGFIFQSFHLLPRATALRNVEVPLVYSRCYGSKLSKAEIRSRAALALEEVGLSDRMQHLPNELSGGQRQRVAIARALVTRPRLLLADEPTGNLDSRTGNDVLRLLRGLVDKGSTVILVTHDASIAQQASRKIVMRDGEIVEDSNATK